MQLVQLGHRLVVGLPQRGEAGGGGRVLLARAEALTGRPHGPVGQRQAGLAEEVLQEEGS